MMCHRCFMPRGCADTSAADAFRNEPTRRALAHLRGRPGRARGAPWECELGEGRLRYRSWIHDDPELIGVVHLTEPESSTATSWGVVKSGCVEKARIGVATRSASSAGSVIITSSWAPSAALTPGGRAGTLPAPSPLDADRRVSRASRSRGPRPLRRTPRAFGPTPKVGLGSRGPNRSRGVTRETTRSVLRAPGRPRGRRADVRVARARDPGGRS